MLSVSKVSAYYGSVQSLADIDVTVDRGEIVTILGANGAGKTTLLKVILGLIKPQRGMIEFLDQRIIGWPTHYIIRLGIGVVAEGRQIFGPMTTLENLRLGAYLQLKKRLQREVSEDLSFLYELFPILKKRTHQKASTLSGGEQQMLAIGRALMSRPKLLVLDEPSLGLAPLIIQNIYDVLAKLNQTGLSLLLVEQNARAALGVAHRGYVLEIGSIALEGSSETLKTNPRVIELYLGK